MTNDRVRQIAELLETAPTTEHQYKGKRFTPAELLRLADMLGMKRKMIVHSFQQGRGGTIKVKLT